MVVCEFRKRSMEIDRGVRETARKEKKEFLTDLLSNNNSKSHNNKWHKSKPTMNKTKKIVMRK